MGYITCSIQYLIQIGIDFKEIYLQLFQIFAECFEENRASERAKFSSSNYLATSNTEFSKKPAYIENSLFDADLKNVYCWELCDSNEYTQRVII